MHEKTSFSSPLSFLHKRSIGASHVKENQFIEKRFDNAKNLFRKDLKGHFGCVNALEFSNNSGEWIVSGGDDMRVLLWNTERAMDDVCRPVPMKGQHHSNIFCLAFDHSNNTIFSGGNDEQVVVHDMHSGETKDVYSHNDAVYGLSCDPCSDHVFASACDDGRILIYDIRAPPSEEPFCLANYMSAMQAVMFNPVESRLVATANAKEGLGLWDVRKPRTCLMRYGGSLSQQSCMSVRISRDGKRLIGLRRRLFPVLYDLHSSRAVHNFDHAGYYNSCTMKSCCFAGQNDEYIISGSDDFNLYVWRIPDADSEAQLVGDAHLVLKGHRSIVNQVRFNPANQLIISSGVEKVVKMWSPYALPNSTGELGIGSPDLYSERAIYTHEEYIHLVLHSGQIMSHDYSTQSTEEDPRMMAFFDSLVQRELENWSSSDESACSSWTLGDALYAPLGGGASTHAAMATTHGLDLQSSSEEESSDEVSSVMSDHVTGLISCDVTRDDGSESDGEPVLLDMDAHSLSQRKRNKSDKSEVKVQNVSGDTEVSNGAAENEASSSGVNSSSQTCSTASSSANDSQTSSNSLSTNTSQANSNCSLSTSDDLSTSVSSLSTSGVNTSSESSGISSTQSSAIASTSSQLNSSTDSIGAQPGTSSPQPIRRRVTIIQSDSTNQNTRDSGIYEPDAIASDETRRTSISNLIKMKRKEYLEGMKRLERKTKKRRKIEQARRREKIKRIKRARNPDYTSSDSDSSDSSPASRAKAVPTHTSGDNIICDVTTSRDIASHDVTETTENVLSNNDIPPQENTVIHDATESRDDDVTSRQAWERLRLLRQRVLNSDSDCDQPLHSTPNKPAGGACHGRMHLSPQENMIELRNGGAESSKIGASMSQNPTSSLSITNNAIKNGNDVLSVLIASKNHVNENGENHENSQASDPVQTPSTSETCLSKTQTHTHDVDIRKSSNNRSSNINCVAPDLKSTCVRAGSSVISTENHNHEHLESNLSKESIVSETKGVNENEHSKEQFKKCKSHKRARNYRRQSSD